MRTTRTTDAPSALGGEGRVRGPERPGRDATRNPYARNESPARLPARVPLTLALSPGGERGKVPA
jgi:hypothetical protein